MSKAEIKFTYKDYKNLLESETKRYELLERGKDELETVAVYRKAEALKSPFLAGLKLPISEIF